MKKIDIWNKIVCFFLGHDVYRCRWHTEYYISLKRKGGKKRNRGKVRHKHSHHEDICLRCGKILKKK